MKFVAPEHKLKSHGQLKNPTGIIVHATAGASGQSSVEWLSRGSLGYAFIIERDGSVITCIPKELVAYHAGKSIGWDGPNCNSYTIGIAFANMDNGRDPITKAQLDTLAELVADLKRKVPSLKYISTHKWVSPGRKVDPVLWSPTGTHFEGLEIWSGKEK